jgi:hypothetical protein
MKERTMNLIDAWNRLRDIDLGMRTWAWDNPILSGGVALIVVAVFILVNRIRDKR